MTLTDFICARLTLLTIKITKRAIINNFQLGTLTVWLQEGRSWNPMKHKYRDNSISYTDLIIAAESAIKSITRYSNLLWWHAVSWDLSDYAGSRYRAEEDSRVLLKTSVHLHSSEAQSVCCCVWWWASVVSQACRTTTRQTSDWKLNSPYVYVHSLNAPCT